MSLRFLVDDDDDVADVVAALSAVVVTPQVDGGKRALLHVLSHALLLPDHVHSDNLDSFADGLRDVHGCVILRNASAWWQQQPTLLGQVCQCFVDADGPMLVLVQ
jgi:hypothetical protein